MSTWISLSTTHVSVVPDSQIMLPKITPDSVDETLIEVLTLWKLIGPRVWVVGLSTSFKSPRVANSRHRFCMVVCVWFTIRTSTLYVSILILKL
jgi:hypothetical protein